MMHSVLVAQKELFTYNNNNILRYSWRLAWKYGFCYDMNNDEDFETNHIF